METQTEVKYRIKPVAAGRLFSFMLPTELDEYLTRKSRETKVPKSELIRKAIELQIKIDE